MRANVKPLTHWIIYKKYTVRFHQRTPAEVSGMLSTPEGAMSFSYNPESMTIQLPQQLIVINEYGWELDQQTTIHTD